MTVRELKDIKRLHNLVIHKRSGSTKQYFLESRKIARLDDKDVRLVCFVCFGR